MNALIEVMQMESRNTMECYSSSNNNKKKGKIYLTPLKFQKVAI